jgi:hypothetical protein
MDSASCVSETTELCMRLSAEMSACGRSCIGRKYILAQPFGGVVLFERDRSEAGNSLPSGDAGNTCMLSWARELLCDIKQGRNSSDAALFSITGMLPCRSREQRAMPDKGKISRDPAGLRLTIRTSEPGAGHADCSLI